MLVRRFIVSLAVSSVAVLAFAAIAAAQTPTPTPMAMTTPMPSTSPMPMTTPTVAAGDQTQLTTTYRLVLHIDVAQTMSMSPSGPGEVMVAMPGMAMPLMNTTDQGQPVNHHIELHIYNRSTGAVITDMVPSITIRDDATGTTRTLPNVMKMYDSPIGVSDTHFGNNAYLPDGAYDFTATVGTESATFASVSVGNGAPLSAPMGAMPMGSASPTMGAMPAVVAGPNTGGGPEGSGSPILPAMLLTVVAVGGAAILVGGVKLRSPSD